MRAQSINYPEIARPLSRIILLCPIWDEAAKPVVVIDIEHYLECSQNSNYQTPWH